MKQLTFSRRALFTLASSVFLVALVAAGLVLAVAVTGEGAAPKVTTDKPEYYYLETVIITGTGFAPNTYYAVPVLRPDGNYVKSDGSSGWNTVLTNGSGGFTYYYKLDSIAGAYDVAVYNTPWAPGSPQVPLATTGFQDDNKDFNQCKNKDPGPDCKWVPGAINTTNSTYYEGDSVPQRLFHEIQGEGDHTMEFVYDFSKSGVYAYDFLGNVDQTLGANLHPCDDLPNFQSMSLATCNSLYSGTAPVSIPPDLFDSVSSRENPPGSGARNFRVACFPTACSDVSVTFPSLDGGDDPGEAHLPDTNPDCFQNCDTSEVRIRLNFTTLNANTLVGVWFGGHLAEAADPDGGGPVEGWGTGCDGSGSCGSSAVTGAPFHLKYISLDGGSVGNRDNQIQIGGELPPTPTPTVTVTPTPTLIVIKHVVNDDGGTAAASAFTMSVTGNSPSPASFPGAESPGTTVSLGTGAYSVSESGPSGYSISYSANCSGSILAGETKTCTVTNNDIAPTLKLVKTVINNNGGTKVVADFPLFIDGTPVTSGVANTVTANALHTASETQQTGYTASAWGGDCAANGTITLLPGDNKTCTITNDDIAPTLKLLKTVINNNGGTKVVADFPLFIDGSPVTSGVANVVTANVVHTASETQQAGYAASVWGGNCAADGTITLLPGDNKTCTITNDDIPPGQFSVSKDFVPNSGASVTVSLSCASGSVSPASASASEASPATFTVTGASGNPSCTATESPIPTGYTSSGTCSAALSAGSCTITNTLNTAQFSVNKDFVPNSGTSVSVSLSCASGNVSPASASASEAAPAAFTVTGFTGNPSCTATESPVPTGYTSSGTCSAALTAGSCTITNTLVPATATPPPPTPTVPPTITPTPTATPPAAVGGITELHVDGTDPSARPTDDSNSSPAVPLSGAIVGAAAAALALAASAWYARRRYLR